MEWHCLEIADDSNPEDAASALIEFVRREYEKAGAPASFSVYQDPAHVEHPLFFFSPGASTAFPELPYLNAVPCPAPDDPESLSRIV